MRAFQTVLMVLLSFYLLSCAGGKKQNVATNQQTEQVQPDPEQILPVDPKIIKGKLDNGLTYYIRKNGKPEKRAELRLVVNAGSILEDDDQQGLAHFLEHMCFNGTEHFQKQELINYLESIGMRFGPEINAYTSFDETVYMLHVPTDSTDIFEKGFLVLQDWAGAVTLDNEEIDKERGVVIEEWRLGRGARMRMLDEQLPILFKGSRYAGRLPIGKKAVLDTFHYDAPKRFYRDWYRPDLMAVIAVGDFDTDYVENLIHENFAHLTAGENPRERESYPVPGHEETLFAITSDPEATNSSVSVYYKLPAESQNTVADYRQRIVERLYNSMFNQRLRELAKKENPPFIFANSGKGQFVRTSEVYMLSAVVKDNGIPRGLETLLTEARRVQAHGFTKSELERTKKSILRSIEKVYAERDKSESRGYASEYIRNFLQDEPIPGIEYEYGLYKKFVPAITIEEINALASEWIMDRNRVFMVDSPEKEGLEIPAEEDLRQVMKKVDALIVEPYKDDVLDQPLVEKEPEASPLVEETQISDIGVTEWALKNGVKVVLKPTDFKNDEILFRATSPGGYSLYPDEELVPAKTASGVIAQNGFGAFTQIQLQKLLSDKVVRVNSYVSEISEGLSGMASPKDIETLFQLIYLTFTHPREDSSAFASYQARMKAYYENVSASPENVYRDSVTVTFSQNHPRYAPFNVEMVEEMDLSKSLEIYRERFADASDFTFFFVGNFDPEELKPLVEKYLGGLPTLQREETWQDKTYTYPAGLIEKTVKKGVEPKSLNTIIFSGPFDWSVENRSKAQTLAEVLRIKLRERLREDKGGTYGVRLSSSFSHYPRERYQLRISWGCNPERVEELTNEVFTQIDSLQQFGPTEEYLEKVKEIGMREYERDMQENKFWLSKLQHYYFHGLDPKLILRIDEEVQERTLADVQEAAQKYLKKDNYVRVVLYPEN